MCDALVFEPLGCCSQENSTAFRKNFQGNPLAGEQCLQAQPFTSTWIFNGTHPSTSDTGAIVGGGASAEVQQRRSTAVSRMLLYASPCSAHAATAGCCCVHSILADMTTAGSCIAIFAPWTC